jgi:hypothetical protein
MIFTVVDPGLDAFLASGTLLAQLWPAAVEDVKILLGTLRLAGATLADVLRHGLVRLSAPSPRSAASQVGLACGTAMLTASAADRDGTLVAEPRLRPSDVWQLAVSDLAVAGASVLTQAAG